MTDFVSSVFFCFPKRKEKEDMHVFLYSDGAGSCRCR